MIHDFYDFMNRVPWLCWLESLDPVFLFNFFSELFYQLLGIVEEQNSIDLFDSGFSFKNIHDSQQGKGDTISLKPLYHFKPPHIHLKLGE